MSNKWVEVEAKTIDDLVRVIVGVICERGVQLRL